MHKKIRYIRFLLELQKSNSELSEMQGG
jgi:hypothetical protein